jgi:tRNA(fMet)-specific endonuclease VapC
MRYMLDTNICIYAIKRGPPELVRRLEALTHGSAVMSVVTYAELRAGIAVNSTHAARDERVLGLLTAHIPVLPFDVAAAERFGVLRAALRERNRDTMDRLIAAHAVSLSLTLVTTNEADFKGYPGLAVENWVSSA